MKKALLVVGMTTFISLVGCGKSQTQTPPAPAYKTGWTSTIVASKKTECVNNGVSSTVCTCIIDKAAVQLTLSDYTNPVHGSDADNTLTQINNDCSK